MLENRIGVSSVNLTTPGTFFSNYKTIINNTTFDTTVLNTLVITAQWNTNNAGNSIYSEIFTLNKTY